MYARMLVYACIAILPACLLFSGCRSESSPPLPPNNIILIVADDLGYGDLGSYGQQRIRTPSLDSMAAQGIRFTQHYAGSTVCAPSRCTIMTGLHTGSCRIRGNGTVPLQPEDLTVAEVLDRAGFATGMIGKWGLGEAGTTGVPNQQGFDYFFGYLNQIRAHNYYPDYLWENDTKYPLDNEIEIVQEGYARGVGSYATKKVQYSHDLFTEKAIDFVKANADTMFFMYLAYTIPHANNESIHNNEHGMEVPDYGVYANEDWPDVEKGAAAMISRLDTDVGRLLDTLEELDIDEHTIVFFTSDNGPHQEGGHDPEFFNSNGPLRGIKRDLYEGGIRVPMIVHWPGTIQPSVSDAPVAFWDFMPTALDLASVATPDNIEGISYMPSLLQYFQPEREYMYWEFHEGGKKQAMWMKGFKGIRFLEEDRIELYNLAEDQSEENNVAADNPYILEQMKYIMDRISTPSETWPLFPDAQ